MSSKRNIIHNKNGVSPVLESLVAIGISISLLVVFFVATNSMYSTHDRPNVDLEAKSIDIMESLLNSPGQGVGYDPSWEMDVDNMSIVGLATHPTIEYGILNTSDEGEITVIYRERVSDSRIGIVKTCFLAGTKVVMADESYKNIEDIMVGDMVKSFDEENKVTVDRMVTQVFHHTRQEMPDYYLVINNQLCVTPNHQVYSDGRWVEAGKLEIGNSLFYPCSDYKVFSIERVFEKTSTYDFSVGINHNYFVAVEDVDALVHNAPPYSFPHADPNGPYHECPNIPVNFDGSGSTWWNYGDPLNTIEEWDWKFYEEDTWHSYSVPTATHTYDIQGTYKVQLKVKDTIGNWNTNTNNWTTVNISNVPHADFTWFDSDSLAPETEISFDASISSYYGDTATFEWW